jgi:chorismate mutase/prephenate dehydratase
LSDGKRETEELRQEQLKLDAQIVAALDRRARIARRLGELRRTEAPQASGGRSMFPSAIQRGSGEMPEETIEAIFREISAACLALELPQKVVYAGQEGTAAHIAARSRFGQTANLVSQDSIQLALDEVARKRADFAVVPLETKADGLVQSTIFQLSASELKIVAVIESAATLHLLNRTGNVADIEKIYTTTADHARCQRFLANHPTRVSVLDVKSPMVACQIALEDHGAAALAFEEFGAPMGLQVARRHVADDAADRTRYAVAGARPSGRSEDDVTAFVFNVQDSPGALLEVLRQLAERGINLLRIQSHPAMGPGWSYLFFVEVSGHATDRLLVTAFEEVKRQTKFFKVLGSYSTSS